MGMFDERVEELAQGRLQVLKQEHGIPAWGRSPASTSAFRSGRGWPIGRRSVWSFTCEVKVENAKRRKQYRRAHPLAELTCAGMRCELRGAAE
jgi:hypothetical protein